jgi:hypothetical protein
MHPDQPAKTAADFSDSTAFSKYLEARKLSDFLVQAPAYVPPGYTSVFRLSSQSRRILYQVPPPASVPPVAWTATQEEDEVVLKNHRHAVERHATTTLVEQQVR